MSGFRNLVTTDGVERFITSDRDLKINPNVLLLTPNVVTGQTFAIFAAQPILLPQTFYGACEIAALMRSSASGSWLLAGNFGLFVNE